MPAMIWRGSRFAEIHLQFEQFIGLGVFLRGDDGADFQLHFGEIVNSDKRRSGAAAQAPGASGGAAASLAGIVSSHEHFSFHFGVLRYLGNAREDRAFRMRWRCRRAIRPRRATTIPTRAAPTELADDLLRPPSA